LRSLKAEKHRDRWTDARLPLFLPQEQISTPGLATAGSMRERTREGEEEDAPAAAVVVVERFGHV
jgi:hypothetical protein